MLQNFASPAIRPWRTHGVGDSAGEIPSGVSGCAGAFSSGIAIDPPRVVNNIPDAQAAAEMQL